MAYEFTITQRALRELRDRLGSSDPQQHVFQFYFDTDVNSEHPIATQNFEYLGPFKELARSIESDPDLSGKVTRLELGVFPAPQIPDQEIISIEGLQIQLNEYWRESLKGFVLDFSEGTFRILGEDEAKE